MDFHVLTSADLQPPCWPRAPTFLPVSRLPPALPQVLPALPAGSQLRPHDALQRGQCHSPRNTLIIFKIYLFGNLDSQNIAKRSMRWSRPPLVQLPPTVTSYLTAVQSRSQETIAGETLFARLGPPSDSPATMSTLLGACVPLPKGYGILLTKEWGSSSGSPSRAGRGGNGNYIFSSCLEVHKGESRK